MLLIFNYLKQCTIVFTRGKQKLGYDLKINIKFRGLNNLEEGKGVLRYSSFCDDGDYEVTIFKNSSV